MLKKWIRTWPGARYWLPISMGAVCGSAVCGLLLYGGAAVISGMIGLPERILPLLTTVIVGGSGFAAGFCAGKCAGEKGLVYGVGAGGLLGCILLAVSLWGYRAVWGAALTTKLAVLLLAAAVGGILSVNTGGKNYHSRKI